MYNLKSMLSVLSAQASSRKEALLRCDGPDEAQAEIALKELLEETPNRHAPK